MSTNKYNACNLKDCPVCITKYETIEEYRDAEADGSNIKVAERWRFHPNSFNRLAKLKTYKFEVKANGEHSQINEKRKTIMVIK